MAWLAVWPWTVAPCSPLPAPRPRGSGSAIQAYAVAPGPEDSIGAMTAPSHARHAPGHPAISGREAGSDRGLLRPNPREGCMPSGMSDENAVEREIATCPNCF
jgi:hypothetical protein